MSKPHFFGFMGLVVLLGSLGLSCWAQQPAKTEKPIAPLPGWSGKYLRAMKEPALWALAKKDRTTMVYRFLWLPSFHDPISVRFIKSDRGVALTAVRLKLDHEYQPVRVVARKNAELRPAHWERIANHLAKARFWDLPRDQREPFGRLTVDGHILIVEGISEGRYHIVVRPNPPGGNFVDLCQAMLFMSGIDVRSLWFDYRG
jgi:hypothetical protein